MAGVWQLVWGVVVRGELGVRVLDLFSGIGGFSLGLERAGMKTIAFCEIDPFCRKVLAKHWPKVPCHDDVRAMPYPVCLDSDVKDCYLSPNTPWEEKMAGKLKKLTSDQAKECVKLYDAGMSIGEIAGYYSISRQGMWDLLRRRTVMRPQKRVGKNNHFHRATSADDHAQNMAEYAIRKGVLTPAPCEVCGENGVMSDGRRIVQAHHDDYNRPLDVRWLCQKHHHEWHKNNTPCGLEVAMEAITQVDVICGGFP